MKNSAHGELVEPCELCASVLLWLRRSRAVPTAHLFSRAQHLTQQTGHEGLKKRRTK